MIRNMFKLFAVSIVLLAKARIGVVANGLNATGYVLSCVTDKS